MQDWQEVAKHFPDDPEVQQNLQFLLRSQEEYAKRKPLYIVAEAQLQRIMELGKRMEQKKAKAVNPPSPTASPE